MLDASKYLELVVGSKRLRAAGTTLPIQDIIRFQR